MIENELLTVAFPKGDKPAKLKFIAKSNTCDMSVHALLYRLREGKRTDKAAVQTMTITKDTDLSLIDFSIPVPKGCQCIVSIFLHYSGYRGFQNSKLMNPGAICYAIETSGVFEDNGDFEWL